MSRDWFDPLGLRGSKLDPFAQLAATLRGDGATGQSMEFAATKVAQQLVGRTIEIDHEPPISATVEHIDEVRPAAPVAAMQAAVGEVPLWKSLSGRLRDASIGEYQIVTVDLAVHDVSLAGATRQQLQLRRVTATAHLTAAEVTRAAAEIDDRYVVRLNAGSMEVTDRRLQRWVWLEVDLAIEGREIVVTPRSVHAFGRTRGLPARFRRAVRRPAPWLPKGLRITDIAVVENDLLVVDGEFRNVVLPLDVSRVLMDLSAEGTRSVLRIALGNW